MSFPSAKALGASSQLVLVASPQSALAADTPGLPEAFVPGPSHPRSRTVRLQSTRPSTTVQVPASSDDLEIPLQLPIRHGVEPLAPLPLARRGEMVDEVV